MSEECHRPRRIIEGPPEPAPQQPPPVTALALLLQQRRFQHALQSIPVRRDGERSRPQPLLAEAATAGDAPQRSNPTPTTSATATRTKGPARPDRTGASRGVGARAAAVPDMPPRPDPCDDAQAWRHAGLPTPAPEGWDRDLADRVARLCRRADPSFQSWSITVPLDPAVLPTTELDISLSQERLALLFRTQSPYSLSLVNRHRARLVALLQRALPFARDIEVETT